MDEHEELSGQEERVIARLFALSPDLMCTLDAQGRFELTNPAFCQMGYTVADLHAKCFVDFLHHEDKQAVALVLEDIEPEKPQHFVARFRNKDESYRRLSWSLTRDRSGRRFGIARDEVGRRSDTEKSEGHHGFLDAIVENIPNMIFVKDAERLAFVRLNRAGEELLGVKREMLLQKTDLDLFPRDEAEFFQQKDRETLNGKVLVDIPEEPIATYRGKRWLHTKKVPILDDHGTPRFLLGISEDITDFKKVQEALLRSQEETRDLNRELESFSYSVAHDLRAPLRSLDGFSQALLEDYDDKLDATGRKYLRFVRESAQEMAQLIDDILTLSRVSRTELEKKRSNLSQLFQTSVERLQRSDPERRVEVSVEEDLFANADHRLMAVVVDNLVGNAWKFSRQEEVARIEFGRQKEHPEQPFFIRDNGAGFDMAYADKLFGVFQRLHSSREFEGTGVGLATVKRILHRHGGHIWAEAKEGEGATFFFTLSDRGTEDE